MYKRLELLLLLLYGVSTGFCIPVTVASDYIHHSRNNRNLSNFHRLPKSVIPQRYNLQLSIYIDENTEKDFTFEGIVKIEIDIKSPVQNITLHSKDLKILPRNLKLEKDFSTIEDFSVEFDTLRDFLIIAKSNGVFQKGSHILSIDYSGELSTDKRGFFKGTYTNGKGEEVWMAATHFEPTAARRAMPCFDEPEYKAIFNVSVVHNKKYTAVFNSPVASISTFDSNERVITHFKEPPRMSTYLLAFLISDFARISNSAKNFSVLARTNAIQNGSIALEFGEKVLKELENYTNVAFAIEKMDQAAVPIFAAGAMENWGLVIYEEGALLSVKEESIVDIIAHEFAHQWFGNLVSPKWWKYLWLNEGFATYFASYISDKINPVWRSIEKSVISSIQSAFDFDSGISSHPVNQDVDSPGEISAMFDYISYRKEGSMPNESTAIKINDHAYLASIQKNGVYTCAGTIVSERIILTTSWCTDVQYMSNLTVRVGSSFISSGGSVHKVVAMTQYRNESSDSNHDMLNLSLLKVSPSLEFKATVRNVELPKRRDDADPGTVVTVYSWGLGMNVKRYEYRIIGRCDKLLSLEQFCAIPLKGYNCMSDVGGPLVINGVMIGLLNLGYECGGPRNPKVYSRVGYYREWIDEKMKFMESLH